MSAKDANSLYPRTDPETRFKSLNIYAQGRAHRSAQLKPFTSPPGAS